MGRYSGSKHNGAKPQARRTTSGSRGSRQRNQSHSRVFGDAPKPEQAPQSSGRPPKVQRTGSYLTYLSIKELDNFGLGMFRRPPYVNFLPVHNAISALRSREGGATRLETDIDNFCLDREPQIPYVVAKGSAKWHRDGNHGFKVYAHAATDTAAAINDEIAALHSALELTNPKVHRNVPIAGFESKSLATEFADAFNTLVLPTDAQIFTLGAIHRTSR